MNAEGEEPATWVRTQPSASGKTYVVTVDFTDDLSTTLKPSEATTYAHGVLAAAMYAAHDAGVFNQLLERGIAPREVTQAIVDLRESRAPLSPTGTAASLEPGVNMEGEPFLIVSLNGVASWQWTVEAAREHAYHVLDAVHAADLDAAYRRYLIGIVGLDEDRALEIVGDLLGRVS